MVTPWPAYFCAAANLAAVVAMATVLAPGTTLVDEPARAAYVRENAALWRAGWSLWVLAAISLLVFYRWWAQRIRASVALLWIAAAGFAVDLVAESLLIVVAPERPDVARVSFILTGGVANGLYTLAGALLSRLTPGMDGVFARWTWTMWTLGAVLSVVTFLELPIAIAAASAALFALFIPWCVAMGRRLA
ncbi:MAG: hypothetical protein ACRDGT_10145 [Candidatus Limnocylindria bacterium]